MGLMQGIGAENESKMGKNDRGKEALDFGNVLRWLESGGFGVRQA